MLFKTKEKLIKVVKLFKIVTDEQANRIDIDSVILETIESLNETYDFVFQSYSINFGHSEYKSYKAFKNFCLGNKDIVDLICHNNFKKFHYSNFLLNVIDEKPDFGVLEIAFSIESEKHDLNSSFRIVKSLNQKIGLDYGYIRELSSDYDLISETKIKKSLFTNSFTLTPTIEESTWNSHKYGIKCGFVKDIYEVNFLNDSYFKKHRLDPLQNKNVGDFYSFDGNISVWQLTNDEIAKVKKALKHSKLLIGSKLNYLTFLDSSDAETIQQKTSISFN